MQKIFETDPQELRKFAKTFAIGGPVIGGLALGWGLWKGHAFPTYAGTVFLCIVPYALITMFTRPILFFPVNVVFATIGHVVQFVINHLGLGFAYFVLMTPVALFFRLTGRDRLNTHYDSGAKSYWEARKPAKPDPKSYEKQGSVILTDSGE